MTTLGMSVSTVSARHQDVKESENTKNKKHDSYSHRERKYVSMIERKKEESKKGEKQRGNE